MKLADGACGGVGGNAERDVGFVDTLLLDGVESGVGAGGELYRDVWHLGWAEKGGGAVLLEVPRHDVAEALGELEGAAGRPEESFPGLGLGLHALGDHVWAVVLREHGSQAKVENVGDVVDEAVADSLVRVFLSGVTEFGALAVGVHGLEHEAAD